MRVPAAGGPEIACPAAQASPGQDSRQARGRAGCCARPAGGHACGEPVGRGGVFDHALSGPHGGSAKAVPTARASRWDQTSTRTYGRRAGWIRSLEDARRCSWTSSTIIGSARLERRPPAATCCTTYCASMHARLVAADQPIQARAAVGTADQLLRSRCRCSAGDIATWTTAAWTTAADRSACQRPTALTTSQEAADWLDAERPNLYAAVSYAAAEGRPPALLIAIAAAMGGYLRARGHRRQQATAQVSDGAACSTGSRGPARRGLAMLDELDACRSSRSGITQTR